MNEHHSASEEDDGQQRSLHTYMRDHTAGAQHAVQLLQSMKHHQAGTSLGAFAADLLVQVEEDLQTLESLCERSGAVHFQVKELAGWLGDKVSRLKLGSCGSLFGTFETLEFLSLGVLGKRALWRALLHIAPTHPALEGVDFSLMIERAEAQAAALESVRLEFATRAFR